MQGFPSRRGWLEIAGVPQLGKAGGTKHMVELQQFSHRPVNSADIVDPPKTVYSLSHLGHGFVSRIGHSAVLNTNLGVKHRFIQK